MKENSCVEINCVDCRFCELQLYDTIELSCEQKKFFSAGYGVSIDVLRDVIKENKNCNSFEKEN